MQLRFFDNNYFLSSVMTFLLLLLISATPALGDGRCVGEADCTVCTDCSRCSYCSIQGNKCGVCSGGVEQPVDANRQAFSLLFKVLQADQIVSEKTSSLFKDISLGEKESGSVLQEIAAIKRLHQEKIVVVIESKEGRAFLFATCGAIARENPSAIPEMLGWEDPANGAFDRKPPDGWIETEGSFVSPDGDGAMVKATPTSIAVIQGTALFNRVVDVIYSTRDRLTYLYKWVEEEKAPEGFDFQGSSNTEMVPVLQTSRMT